MQGKGYTEGKTVYVTKSQAAAMKRAAARKNKKSGAAIMTMGKVKKASKKK